MYLVQSTMRLSLPALFATFGYETERRGAPYDSPIGYGTHLVGEEFRLSFDFNDTGLNLLYLVDDGGNYESVLFYNGGGSSQKPMYSKENPVTIADLIGTASDGYLGEWPTLPAADTINSSIGAMMRDMGETYAPNNFNDRRFSSLGAAMVAKLGVIPQETRDTLSSKGVTMSRKAQQLGHAGFEVITTFLSNKQLIPEYYTSSNDVGSRQSVVPISCEYTGRPIGEVITTSSQVIPGSGQSEVVVATVRSIMETLNA